MKPPRVIALPPLSHLQKAVAARLAARTLASGTVAGPCVPTLHAAYVKKLEALFAIMDRPLADDRRQALAKLLAENLAQGFDATPHARISIDYRPIDGEPPGVHCDIKLEGPSAEELYFAWRDWLDDDEGLEAQDDTLLALLKELKLPTRARALAVGPGARHAQALVGPGFRVEAFEPVRIRARELLRSSANRSFALKVVEQDALDEVTALTPARYDLIVVEDIAPRLSPSELQRAVAKLAPALAPGGRLLFNLFLLEASVVTNEVEREAAQRCFSTYLTEAELLGWVEQLGLKLWTKSPTAARTPERREPGSSARFSSTQNAAQRKIGGYRRWSAGERSAPAGARALPLRLHWLALAKA